MTADTPFAQFWQRYPRKVAKWGAQRAFQSAMRRGATLEAILSRLDTAIRSEWSGHDTKFVPHPSKWLNGEDFDDECEAAIDDKEPLPIFDLIDRRARASMLRDVLLRELKIWERAAECHQHSDHCDMGRRCVFVEDKRPTIPTLDEIEEQMR